MVAERLVSDALRMSRRRLIGAAAIGSTAAAIGSGAATASPLTPAERLTSVPLEFVYEAIVTLGPAEQVGATPYGKRVRIPITGGSFAGPRLSGTILPEGMDWQLIRADGSVTLEAAYLMREKDGTLIQITNRGVAFGNQVRATPVFEAPLGPHQWLNQSVFTATVGPAEEARQPAVRITVYRLA